jgi:hypothetical protein
MKKSFLVILAVFISSGVAFAQQSGKVITIIGEVVETQCYVSGLTGPGKGMSHKDCAVKCARGGIPLSILEEKTGDLYLAGQTRVAMKGAYDILFPFIAEKVKVTGRVFEKGGMKLLIIKSVNKIDEVKGRKKHKK